MHLKYHCCWREIPAVSSSAFSLLLSPWLSRIKSVCSELRCLPLRHGAAEGADTVVSPLSHHVPGLLLPPQSNRAPVSAQWLWNFAGAGWLQWVWRAQRGEGAHLVPRGQLKAPGERCRAHFVSLQILSQQCILPGLAPQLGRLQPCWEARAFFLLLFLFPFPLSFSFFFSPFLLILSLSLLLSLSLSWQNASTFFTPVRLFYEPKALLQDSTGCWLSKIQWRYDPILIDMNC